jgi:hypothetical protein
MDENEFRSRFAQLREDDRKRAPSFAQTFRRVRAQRSALTILRMRPLLIGAAAAVAVAATWVTHARQFGPLAAPIATWRAPTDVFLPTSGSEMLTEMPALGASVLDTMIPTPSNTGA